jgi:hypothetical protein
MNTNEYFAPDGEDVIKQKVAELKSIQGKLDEALRLYKESIADLEAAKASLVPEVMDAFKGQTEGAEKLKVKLDDMMVEIIQESEKSSTSYKDAFETALTKVNENTKKVLQQILENSKVASKVKGQLKIDGSKVYEGSMMDWFSSVKEWLSKAYNKINIFSNKAEEGLDEIDAMINQYDQEQGDMYAAKNMDDFESGAVYESLSRMKKIINF